MNKNRRKPSSSEAANASELRRREWIQSTLGLAVVTAFPGVSIGESVQSDLVRTENEKPGTRDWMLKNTRVDPNTKYRCPWIEGYCSHTSIRAGESIQFFVSTNPASSFTIEIYRMGYYGGDGGRFVTKLVRVRKMRFQANCMAWQRPTVSEESSVGRCGLSAGRC